MLTIFRQDAIITTLYHKRSELYVESQLQAYPIKKSRSQKPYLIDMGVFSAQTSVCAVFILQK